MIRCHDSNNVCDPDIDHMLIPAPDERICRNKYDLFGYLMHTLSGFSVYSNERREGEEGMGENNCVSTGR